MTAYFDHDHTSHALTDEDLELTLEASNGTIAPPGEVSELIRRTLEAIGEDPEREGLRKTPDRVERSLAFLTSGYHQDLHGIVNGALFESNADDIVLVRNIEVFSMCEHHMLPFWGRVHVAYIPNGKVIGLSKLPRIVDMYARRLQLQERMTAQIATAVDQVLKPRGVAVISECRHMCMMMRGVQKNESTTLSRALRGTFRTTDSLRSELNAMLRNTSPE